MHSSLERSFRSRHIGLSIQSALLPLKVTRLGRLDRARKGRGIRWLRNDRGWGWSLRRGRRADRVDGRRLIQDRRRGRCVHFHHSVIGPDLARWRDRRSPAIGTRRVHARWNPRSRPESTTVDVAIGRIEQAAGLFVERFCPSPAVAGIGRFGANDAGDGGECGSEQGAFEREVHLKIPSHWGLELIDQGDRGPHQYSRVHSINQKSCLSITVFLVLNPPKAYVAWGIKRIVPKGHIGCSARLVWCSNKLTAAGSSLPV